METFIVGDRGASNLDAKGMRRNERFEVIVRDELHLLGMVYATLTVRSVVDGRELRLVNGGLVVSRATH